MKVHYQSMANWQDKSDYLRCNPMFHNHPRYDHVLINTVDKLIFGQLLLVFTCVVGGVTYPFALIQPLDAPIGRRRQKDIQKDNDLGFCRLRTRPRSASEFISVRSIICGALIAQDFEMPGDYLVVDSVDTDMFLRIKAM
jgi:hypothetical protein